MRIVKLFVINLIIIIYSLEILTFLFIPSEQIYLEIFKLLPDLSEKFYEYKTTLF